MSSSAVTTVLLASAILLAPSLSLLHAEPARSLPESACRLLTHEEQVELDEAALEVDLARSRFTAHEKIYGLIRGLWEAEAVQRMTYLEAKYDYDAFRLDRQRADLVLERQTALVEEYLLICAGGSPDAIDRAHLRYRRADCAQQAKAIEVAQVDLEFAEQFLASIRDLRQGDVATRQDVILAELDVELETIRLADARRRAETCRQELAGPAPPS